MAKVHTVIVRGISRDQKNSLKRVAKIVSKRASVNSYLLSVIDDITCTEIAAFKKAKIKPTLP